MAIEPTPVPAAEAAPGAPAAAAPVAQPAAAPADASAAPQPTSSPPAEVAVQSPAAPPGVAEPPVAPEPPKQVSLLQQFDQEQKKAEAEKPVEAKAEEHADLAHGFEPMLHPSRPKVAQIEQAA